MTAQSKDGARYGRERSSRNFAAQKSSCWLLLNLPSVRLLAETLRRLRSSSSQIIRIERVNVRDGGQAVIGNIKHGGSHENG
jgi:hypothetical protein